MDISSLKYDPESDYWVADTGERFIKNVFREDSPVWILAGSTEWRARYQNKTHTLFWPPQLPQTFSSAARRIVHQRMTKRSPSSLQNYDLLMNSLARIQAKHGASIDLGELGRIRPVELIWAELNTGEKVTFREFYRNLTECNLCGATRYVADQMAGWKARNDIQTLRAVLRWDPNAGALSTSELEVLRRVLEDPATDETTADHFVRVYVLICPASAKCWKSGVLATFPVSRKVSTRARELLPAPLGPWARNSGREMGSVMSGASAPSGLQNG